MFNPSSVVIEAFVDELVEHYVNMYGKNESDIQLIISNSRNALEIIANSDAPYHDVNHTIMVTMVGTEILRGKILIEGSVSANDWVHFVISLLNHDIGYVRGICRADRSGRYAINMAYDTIAPMPGSTDASLTPYHVDRAKLYITERFESEDRIDTTVICENIERTRFPVPYEEDHQESEDFPGLIRAADLIGQLGDPQYHRKISSLLLGFKINKNVLPQFCPLRLRSFDAFRVKKSASGLFFSMENSMIYVTKMLIKISANPGITVSTKKYAHSSLSSFLPPASLPSSSLSSDPSRVWTPTRFLGELDETARWKHSLDDPKVLRIFYNFLT